MADTIENKVAASGLINLNLEDFYPKGKRIQIDLKEFLFEGLILKEKEFRSVVKSYDWNEYKDAFVAIHCSVDAIVPTWAYMLVSVHLEPHAQKIVFGDLNTLETILFHENLEKIDLEKYRNEKIIINGCGNLPIHESAYVEITRILKPVVQSLMFGEACSTVPLYKRPSKT